jgi:hypothetical protein
MSAEVKKEIQLEIGHVLFMDIVGYSKLLINEQRALRETLNQIVRQTETFRTADATGSLIKSPTGDGMALVFHGSPEEPVECALEISRALKAHPELPLRIGVHSGPVSGVVDVNDQTSVAGAFDWLPMGRADNSTRAKAQCAQTERPAFFVTRGVAGLTKCGFRLFPEDLFHVAYFALHFAADFFCGAAVP